MGATRAARPARRGRGREAVLTSRAVLNCVLILLQELDVMFGMHDFEKNLSEPPNVVKVACCQALGKSLSSLQAFRRLR